MNKQRKNRKGFTLVEVIVVLAILSVACAVATIGVMSFMRWSSYKKQNEYAHTLYVAAQNELTEYSEAGQLKDLSLLMEKTTNIVPLEALTTAAGEQVTADTIWSHSQAAKKGNTLYYIMGTPDDYAKYQAGEYDHASTIADRIKKELYDIFDSFLYDKSMLEGNLCLEFDPYEGLVYSVLYSDQCDASFTYAEGKETNICNRQEETSDGSNPSRKDNMLGYYGVEELSKSISNDAQKPVISNVVLTNGETLNLSFNLSRVKEATMELKYAVSVYDANTNQELLTITMNDDSLQSSMDIGKNYHLVSSSNTSDRGLTLQCQVASHTYDSATSTTPSSTVTGLYTFPAWVDDSGVVTLVLDAVDLSATQVQYTLGDTTALADTFSIYRFGLNQLTQTTDTENIYCRVYGSGDHYKRTAIKQSGTEHMAFGSYTPREESKESSTPRSYTLTNGRHLYNMRFVEAADTAEEENTTFVVSNNINWKTMLRNQHVYADTVEKATALQSQLLAGVNEVYPSITELRAGDTLTGTKEKDYTIAGLTISNVANAAKNIWYTYQGLNEKTGTITTYYKEATGLFLVNKGTIEKVTLEDLTVDSTGVDTHTGASPKPEEAYPLSEAESGGTGGFCGSNAGTLRELSVIGKSSVTGTDNVGGITGTQEYAFSSRIKEDTLVYEGLTNRANVTGFKYVGGIVGHLKSQRVGYEDVTTGKISYYPLSIRMETCNNYGQVRGDQKDSRYIGGILGFSEKDSEGGDFAILQCNSSPAYTDSEITALLEKKENLYGSYVGGIVGYNEATINQCSTQNENRKVGYVVGYEYVGGIAGANVSESIDGVDSQSGNGRNAANVIGVSYVGGIVGQNIQDTLTNWENTGVVLAAEQYAGGITGYNTGGIYECSTSTEYDQTARLLRRTEWLTGDYVGGIAGYNSGVITSESEKKVAGVVRGGDYIGGIAGYNSKDGDIKGYQFAAGYVEGRNFVGGFVGGNTSLTLLQNKKLVSKANAVNGQFCVGGIVGGSVLAATTDVTTSFETNNFLGVVSASQAIAGGYIGYNAIVPADKDADSYMEKLAEALTKADDTTAYDRMETTLGAAGSASLVIGSNEEGTDARFGTISAKLYAGGVIGANKEGCSLTIRNVTNSSKILVSKAVKTQEKGKGDDFSYAYAGGIIGKVTEATTLISCQNSGAGEVEAEMASYTGGLAEVNCGRILTSTSRNMGQNEASYLGGIVGLNKGVIEDCTFNGTIIGNSYIGGMVAENYGTITNPQITKGLIIGYGSSVGGVAASSEGSIYFTRNATLQASIQGEASLVGGVVGHNSGTVLVQTGVSVKMDSGSMITGTKNVGGFIGEQTGKERIVENLRNYGTIAATNGNVGGIVGKSENSTIRSCENHGSVTASKSGDAGGIVASNTGTISSCRNVQSVMALNGTTGGIAGTNTGLITNCQVREESSYTIAGLDYAGGIAGCNTAKGQIIQSDIVGNITVSNRQKSTGGMVGGIAGKNTGELTLEKTAVSGITIQSYTNESALGGVTGVNVGYITSIGGQADIAIVSMAYVKGTGANCASFGGVAGVNLGSISGCAVTMDRMQGNRGSGVTGYGGIAGVSGDGVKTATITDCSFDGQLYANGTASAITNLGGIVGKNYPASTVTNCIVGANPSTTDTLIQCGEANTAYGYTGGMVGWNQGIVRDSDNKRSSTDVVSVIGYAGHCGGIVGFNDQKAVVTGTSTAKILSTGEKWSVEVRYYSNDCGTGGILGYSSSGKDMSYVVNYANVDNTITKANNITVGGLIGRLENKESLHLTFSHCDNYGNLTGYVLVGGLVGRQKYKGSTYFACNNYGEIGRNSYSVVAGGILASVYLLDAGETIYFDGCTNGGKIIAGSAAAGILAREETSNSNNSYIFTDCVNTGVLQAGSNCAGIVATLSSGYGKLYRCRNYGLAYNADGSSKMSGLSDCSHTNVLHDNFSFSNAGQAPLYATSPSNRLYNFYVRKQETVGSSSIDRTEIYVAEANMSSGYGEMVADTTDKNLSATYDGDEATRSCVYASNLKEVSLADSKSTVTLTYRFAKAQQLSGAGVQWFHNTEGDNNTARRYLYKLYYLDQKGQEVEITNPFDTVRGLTTRVESVTSYADRKTYLGGYYVEVGTNSVKDSTYYHPVNEDGSVVSATGLVIRIYEIQNCDIKGQFFKQNGWGDTNYSISKWNGTRTYVNIRNILATNTLYDSTYGSYGSNTAAGQQLTTTPYILSYSSSSNPSDHPGYDSEAVYSYIQAYGRYQLQDENRHFILTDIQTDPMGASYGYYRDLSDYQNYKSLALNQLTYRYKLIKELEEKIPEYYKKEYSQTSAPDIASVTAEDAGGSYAVSWTLKNTSSLCYEYEVQYVVQDELGRELVKDTLSTVLTNRKISIDDDWFSKGGKRISFKVRSVAWRWNVKTSSYEKIYSPWKETAASTLRKPLPTPAIHLELISTDGLLNRNFKVILDNPGAYKESDCTIVFTSSNGTISFKASAGESAPFSLGNNAGNQTLRVQALPMAGDTIHSKSIERGVQSMVLPANVLRMNDYCNTEFDGFYGNTPDSLYYQMKLTGLNDIEAYYNTELLYYDETLKTKVAVSYGESHISASGVNTFTATLSSLPNALLNSDTITIRCYPWRTQGYMIYYGHEVASHITSAEEVKAVTDGGESIFTNGNLKKGYVIQQSNDGMYRVLYSSILANEYDTASSVGDVSKQVDVRTYRVETNHESLTDMSNNTQIPIQPMPEIVNEDPTVTVDGKEGLLFKWDVNKSGSSYTHALYNLTLLGISNDGTEVELTSAREVEAREKFFLNSNWNYPKYRLKVVRVGVSDSNTGKTTCFGSYSSRTFQVKLHLSRIAQPQIKLKEVDQIPEKNSLLYHVSWMGLTSQDELDELEYYRITVTGSQSGTHEFTTTDGNSTNLEVDLNSLIRGETVLVSVQAIAKSDSLTYRDSLKGVEREMLLPERLYPPQMAESGTESNRLGLYLTPAYKEDGSVSVTDFERELVLDMYGKTEAENGRYEIVVQVYDSKEASNPVYTLPYSSSMPCSKEHPLVMAGNLDKSEYVIQGLSAAYAGKYLKVIMRSVSDSQLSSVWTDEYTNVNDGNDILACQWLKLPKVQVDTSTVTEELSQETYAPYFNGEQSIEEADQIRINQLTLQYSLQRYTNTYEFTIIGSPEAKNQEEYIYTTYPVYRITLSKEKDTWVVTYSSTATGEVSTTLTPSKERSVNELTYYELPYGPVLTDYDEDGLATGVSIHTKSWLCLDTTANTVALILPDFYNRDNRQLSNFKEDYKLTQNVSLQTDGESQERYTKGLIRSWYRTVKNSNDITAIRELSRVQAPVIPLTIAPSKDPDVYYEISGEGEANGMLLEVTLTPKEALRPKKTIWLPVYAYNNVTDSSLRAFIGQKDIKGYEDASVSLRYQVLLPKAQGVSEWTIVE